MPNTGSVSPVVHEAASEVDFGAGQQITLVVTLNPFGCEEASNDTMSIASWGLELGYAWQATPAVELFVTGLWQQD